MNLLSPIILDFTRLRDTLVLAQWYSCSNLWASSMGCKRYNGVCSVFSLHHLLRKPWTHEKSKTQDG